MIPARLGWRPLYAFRWRPGVRVPEHEQASKLQLVDEIGGKSSSRGVLAETVVLAWSRRLKPARVCQARTVQPMSVSAFPVSPELSSVRIVADAIARLPNDEAAVLWDETAKHLLSVAIERGHDTDRARTEVVRFFDAVQRMRTTVSSK
ncbi:DUF6074 family protein [Mesorhizobium australicum]